MMTGLPKNRRRLTIDQATAALKGMGFRLDFDSHKFDLKTRVSSYVVWLPSGQTQVMAAKEIVKLIYSHGRQA
jgi:hypothetical protein